ncbi:MAG TPA: aminotransferase class III-fold pyridoxal phosphate-dependent enzyme [Candidatus Limnocylindrales bacterium]|nr:aminotransferase class III-fold pyridoxal phosphate-dependent enzyme [Candidatus Limnocylindrales bacterium]
MTATDPVGTMAAGDILAERRRRLGPSLSLAYRAPLHIVRGSGAYLYDAEGRAYLDCVNNVAHVGHAHPRVVEAGTAQMRILNTNTRYLHENIVRYADRLTALLPDHLEVCFFVNSGSEANELALRLARTATGRPDVATVDVAYHGNTQRLIEVSPYKFNGPGGAGRATDVQVVPLPDPYRGAHRGRGPEVAESYLADSRAVLDDASARGRPAGALIAEAIPSTAGQVVPPDGWLAGLFDAARAVGAVPIADEVQVGFGRVGTDTWAFGAAGARPDVVTLGKPIGNGHPLGAVVTTRAIADAFANGMEYFNTFGGNPVSAAIGLAVLDVIADEGLQENARVVGERLIAGLRELANRHEAIGDVRGRGLFAGFELVRDRVTLEPDSDLAADIANGAAERGVLLSTDGPFHNVIKIKPPLVFSAADGDRLIQTIDDVLGEVTAPRS